MTDEQKRMSSDRAWDYRKQQAFNLAAGAAGLGWGAAKGVVKAGAGMVDYGYDKAKNADKGTIWLIFAIVIALIDIFLGEKYHGYRFTLSGFVNINILGIITSTLFLGFAIFRIGWDIIDRHLSFFMIVLIYMIIKFSGAKIMEFRINALYVSIAFWLIMLIFILFKLRGNDMSIFLQEDVAFMIFIFVLAYFWWQPGWQNESKTWLHFGFILLFGSFFMRTHEQKKSWWYYLTIILLLFDFYGYSLLMDFAGLDYIFSLFPPLLVFVGGYISYRAENQLALIFVLVFAGLMFLALGTFIFYLSLTNNLTTHASYQVSINIFTAKVVQFAGQYTKIIPEAIWALIFFLAFAVILSIAARQFSSLTRSKKEEGDLS